MTAPTPEERAEWQALAEAATPGPWEASKALGGRSGALELNGVRSVPIETTGEFDSEVSQSIEPADAAFIAAAREGWPRTLAALEEAEQERDEAQMEYADCLRGSRCPQCSAKEWSEASHQRARAEAAEAERDRLREGLGALADACQRTYDAGADAYTHGALRQLHYMAASDLRALLGGAS